MLGLSLSFSILLGLLPIKNKKWNMIFILFFATILSLIFIGNNYTPDQFAYSVLYKDPSYFVTESGYIFISSLFSKMGFSYSQFKIVIMFLGAILIKSRFANCDYRFIKCALILWCFTSFWFDVEQSRFMIAMVIIIYSTKFLDKKSLKNICIYITLILLATTIHTTSIVYLILLCKFINLKHLKLLYLIITFFCLINIVNGNDLSYLGKLFYAIIKNEKILLWFNFTTRFGWIGPVFLQLYTLFLFSFGNRSINTEMVRNNYPEMIKMYENWHSISRVLYLIIPMYLASTEFIRIERAFFIPYFICFSMAAFFSSKKDKIIWIILLVIFVLLFNIQGLQGILYNNSYFLDMVTQNIYN